MAAKFLGHPLQDYTQYAELKQLAYNIASAQQQKLFHSLAVLSVFPAEGKTFFCTALAMVYADVFGAKVMVVDTTTFQSKGSLNLRQAMISTNPLIEARSLAEAGRLNDGEALPTSDTPGSEQGPVLDVEIGAPPTMNLVTARENDISVLRKVTGESAKRYNLTLVDTAPLNARNKGNLDPIMAARLCDASLLVVSKRLLDSPAIDEYLKVLADPSLRLLGVVANEEFA